MVEGSAIDDGLVGWERERRALIQAAMDRGDLKVALAFTLESQFALGLHTLNVGGFPRKVRPASQSMGVMPLPDAERFVREARAYLEAKRGGPTHEDAAGLAAIEGVYVPRALLVKYLPGDASSEKIYLAIILAAARSGVPTGGVLRLPTLKLESKLWSDCGDRTPQTTDQGVGKGKRRG